MELYQVSSVIQDSVFLWQKLVVSMVIIFW